MRQGDSIRSLQIILQRISAYIPEISPVIPDGIYGEQTIHAVMSLQRHVHLPVTGIVDAATWAEIAALYQKAEDYFSAPQHLEIYMRPGQCIAPEEENLHLHLVAGMFRALSQVYDNVPPDIAGALRWLQGTCSMEQSGMLDRPTWRQLSGLYRLAVYDGNTHQRQTQNDSQ